jgi:hypothetical protein
MSMRFYSGLALFAVLAYLLAQYQANAFSTEFEGGSKPETERPGNQVREGASPAALTKAGCRPARGI